jgi:hypothetical protein
MFSVLHRRTCVKHDVPVVHDREMDCPYVAASDEYAIYHRNEMIVSCESKMPTSPVLPVPYRLWHVDNVDARLHGEPRVNDRENAVPPMNLGNHEAPERPEAGHGAPETTRTSDTRFRKPLLYPY